MLLVHLGLLQRPLSPSHSLLTLTYTPPTTTSPALVCPPKPLPQPLRLFSAIVNPSLAAIAAFQIDIAPPPLLEKDLSDLALVWGILLTCRPRSTLQPDLARICPPWPSRTASATDLTSCASPLRALLPPKLLSRVMPLFRPVNRASWHFNGLRRMYALTSSAVSQPTRASSLRGVISTSSRKISCQNL